MTKQHIEFVLSGYGVPFTDALADKLLEMFDEEAASYQYTINELNKALSENKGEWIPISERLPEDDTEVIYCDKNGVRGNCHYWKGFNRYPRDKGEYQFPNDIVAWMPLPEPYKENET